MEKTFEGMFDDRGCENPAVLEAHESPEKILEATVARAAQVLQKGQEIIATQAVSYDRMRKWSSLRGSLQRAMAVATFLIGTGVPGYVGIQAERDQEQRQEQNREGAPRARRQRS